MLTAHARAEMVRNRRGQKQTCIICEFELPNCIGRISFSACQASDLNIFPFGQFTSANRLVAQHAGLASSQACADIDQGGAELICRVCTRQLRASVSMRRRMWHAECSTAAATPHQHCCPTCGCSHKRAPADLDMARAQTAGSASARRAGLRQRQRQEQTW